MRTYGRKKFQWFQLPRRVSTLLMSCSGGMSIGESASLQFFHSKPTTLRETRKPATHGPETWAATKIRLQLTLAYGSQPRSSAIYLSTIISDSVRCGKLSEGTDTDTENLYQDIGARETTPQTTSQFQNQQMNYQYQIYTWSARTLSLSLALY